MHPKVFGGAYFLPFKKPKPHPYWMGFVYTFPEHRGHRHAGKLLDEIERIAKGTGTPKVYISTNHTGLYEKYGCEFKALMNDRDGTPSRVYVKRIHL